MFFEVLALALTIRCLVVVHKLRDGFFHGQAWRAWMTFLYALLALHLTEMAGVVVLTGPEVELTLLGSVIEVAAMVTLWLAVELSMSTLARSSLEAHAGARVRANDRDKRAREALANTQLSVQPNGSSPHSPGEVSLDPVMQTRRSHV